MAKYGLTIYGINRVFRKDRQVQGKDGKQYNISDVWFNVSEQEQDGTWFNKSVNLVFKKGAPIPENNTVIELMGFPVIRGKGEYRNVNYMITDWKLAEQPKEKPKTGFAPENSFNN